MLWAVSCKSVRISVDGDVDSVYSGPALLYGEERGYVYSRNDWVIVLVCSAVVIGRRYGIQFGQLLRYLLSRSSGLFSPFFLRAGLLKRGDKSSNYG